jgi:hypothetical protein
LEGDGQYAFVANLKHLPLSLAVVPNTIDLPFLLVEGKLEFWNFCGDWYSTKIARWMLEKR